MEWGCKMKSAARVFTQNGTSVFPLRFVWILVIVMLQTGRIHGNEVLDSYPCMEKCLCAGNRVSGLTVDCTAKNLTELPEDLDENIVNLDLSMNNITSLPDYAFTRLRRLEMLRLVGNSLTSLPSTVFSGCRLTHLHLQGNQFEEVPSQALRGLHTLILLYLDANRIKKVPHNSFRSLNNLQQLRLDANYLTEVPVIALNFARKLRAVNLALNQIETIPDYAFRNLTDLIVLILSDNHIRDIGDHAFDGLQVANLLELNKNRLTHLPTALSAMPDLLELNVEYNQIEYLPDHCFSGNKKLSILQLQDNPISSVGKKAFSHLPSLKDLLLSEARDLTEFPDLTGTTGLEKIVLDRASIRVIPANICRHMEYLEVLDVHSNQVAAVPDLSACRRLSLINLGNNEISSIESTPFKDLTALKDLILGYNYIGIIPGDAFQNLTRLQYLDLSHNRISSIHPEAFSALARLEDLNLGENRFPVLPTSGLENLRHLKTFHNRELLQPPPFDAFPKIQTLALAYAYHCCDFIRQAKEVGDIEKGYKFEEEIKWLQKGSNMTGFWSPDQWNITDPPIVLDDSEETNLEHDESEQDEDEYDFLFPAYDIENIVLAKPPIDCRPTPGPFLPCDDLFGWWSLRCGVWIVFLLAVLGNGAVLFVSVTSRAKMDVTRFLICNLACADLFMGIYLGFLAIVDASTLGEFEKYAVRWQISPGCLVAGFLGVLSSELSVFTLTVITMERFYAISNAMQLDKRLSLRQAGYIMSCGWAFCLAVASLPLFHVSDYRKFAICLPFETENGLSLGYVCFIMIFNAVSFLVIVCCYLAMYIAIRGSHAWNSNDTVVAKRMALLVFTDFFCWAPIIFFSITAAFESNFAILSLDEAKVLTIFVLPLNSCANPFLYAFFTRQFKRDCVKLCKRIEESNISRHFPNSGMRRPSSSSNRPSQSNTLPAEKRGSCSRSVSSGDSVGHVSNNNAESDVNVKKVHFSDKEEPLQYVRSDSGIYLGETKSIQLSDLSPDSDQRRLQVTMETGMHETNFNYDDMGDNEEERDDDDDDDTDDIQGSTPDIILHTEKGHIYLSTAPFNTGSPAKRHSKDSTNRKTGGKGELPPPVELKKRCRPMPAEASPVRKPRHASCKAVRNRPDTTGVLESPVNQEVNEQSLCNSRDTSSAQTNIPKLSAPSATSGSTRKGRQKLQRSGKPQALVKTTQTEMELVDVKTIDPMGANPSLPRAVGKRDRNKQINEWRKTSHLSFIWRNSDNFDSMIPKQKSNSLVELTRPVRDLAGPPCKRHSLSSHHEGYFLLKNGTRDSAYDDDDLYEFHEGREVYVPHAKLKSVRTSHKYSIIPQSRKRVAVPVKGTMDPSKIEELGETSNLLGESGCCDPPDGSPKRNKSTDEESGISINS